VKSDIAQTIRGLPYFADLPDELIDSVCEGSQQLDLDAGTVIIEEGSDSEEMYVVVSGQLVVTKHTAAKEVELARLGPGEVVGEIALLDEAPRTATVRTTEESSLIKVPVAAFESLLKDSRVVRRMFRTVTSRLRDIEDTLRHEERMAALGRMAAQLMHELNNPAAAVGRSAQELSRLYNELGTESGVLAGALTGKEPVRPQMPETRSSLDQADAEDALVRWLEDHNVPDPWDLAPALVSAGWTSELLDQSIAGLSEEIATNLARWIGLNAAAEQVIGELGIGARRISELVRVVKDYSYLDQAPIQEIDPTSGIQDTLILLKHKLRDVEVVLEFEQGLAHVEAPGRDLNQIWTNLIDNAADAMDESGTLTISARNDANNVVITVADTGTGMPADVAERIFDPFYTTKEPGKGTGLGLHTVHNIITRIGGDIKVSSSSSGTSFTITLPAVS
jgi:signal transduction histidine kinase